MNGSTSRNLERFSRVAKNAIFGDGSVRVNKATAAITFYSTDLALIQHKEKLLNHEGIDVVGRRMNTSGYGGTKNIHVITTNSKASVKTAVDAGVEELIKDITKEDLILWYLDDGSWHIRSNTMHLYSNNLNLKQSELLSGRIRSLYGIEPSVYVDAKKDGRQFYYLYFPRELVRIVRPEVSAYISKNEISSMWYKVGGETFSENSRRYLTESDVSEIRNLYRSGITIKRLSEKYGKDYSTIRRVVRYETHAG